jgi:hypothetical protein
MLGLGDLAEMMFAAVQKHRTTEFMSADLAHACLVTRGSIRTPREQSRGIVAA